MLVYSFIPNVDMMFAESEDVITSLIAGMNIAIGMAAMQNIGERIL